MGMDVQCIVSAMIIFMSSYDWCRDHKWLIFVSDVLCDHFQHIEQEFIKVVHE